MKKNLLLLTLGLCTLYVKAQNKNYWQAVSESEVSSQKDVWGKNPKPASYVLYHLDETALAGQLQGTPSEKDIQQFTKGTIISVPGADGKLHQFSIVESAIMQPELAAKYTGIKTYIGKGMEDPSAVIHLSITPSGFSAMVMAAGKETWYVNTLDKKASIYAAHARNEMDAAKGFQCGVEESILKSTDLSGNADDHTLRQYKLALCVNAEFSQSFLDGTEPDTAAMKAKVMDALIVCLDRANMVFERDFGIRMNFIKDQDKLIFTDPATDPWPRVPDSRWNSKTQTTIDGIIGAANYDIGHLLGKVPAARYNNGNAGCIGCVCTGGSKGSAFTAYDDPSLTDYMVIDYWAHEIGHQFGATHTFTWSIENDNPAQLEPGSGSTIMGYAGITGETDVQPHSDDLFSIATIVQVSRYTKTGDGSACAIASDVPNTAPVVNAGRNYTIPSGTPFKLTGTATDANAEDVLSYIWEQVDVYEPGSSNTFPKPASTTGPVFRTYNTAPATERYFPALTDILSGSTAQWEALPKVSRELNFRFTARDNHIGGGNNKSDDAVVTVSAASGPFRVGTQNDTPHTWVGNREQVIKWHVAKTRAAPVNCKKVNILLSVDGGLTFPHILAANTRNDGLDTITVPNLGTTHARLKVEAVGNIFFTISNKDFTIESVLPVTWLSFTAQRTNGGAALLQWSTTNEYNNKYFVIERSGDKQNFLPCGQVLAGNTSTAIQQYMFTDYKTITGINYYRLKQVDADGRSSYSAIATVIMPENALTWSVQPNPAKTATTLYMRKNLSNVSVIVLNTEGKIVYRRQLQAAACRRRGPLLARGSAQLWPR